MSRIIRRAAAGVGTVALLAVGVQLLGTTAASAHDNHVTGVAACQANGTYTVTWTVVNDWSQGVDAVTVNGYTPSGAALAPNTLSLNPVNTPGSTGIMTESAVPGNATSASIDIKGHWAYDGFTQPSRTGSVSLPGTCGPSQQATAPTWANGACVNGTVTQPTITIPSDTGVTYTDNGTVESPGTYQAGTGQHTVVASSHSVTLSGTTTWVFSLTQAAGTCGPRTTTPVTPTVTAISCVDHKPTRPGLVLPTTTGITYLPQSSAPYHAGEHVVVVAIAKQGYKFTTVPSGWQRVSSKRASTTVVMPKPKNCGSSIAPAGPKVTEAYCPAGQTHPVAPTLTVLADTAEIHYRVVTVAPAGAKFGTTTSYQPGQTVKVIATAKKGYYFAAVPAGWTLVSGTQAVRTITFSSGPNSCTVNATVTKPGFTAEQCTGGTAKGGTYTIPTTTGVVYEVNGKQTPAGTYPAPPNSTVTVVAMPKPHYKLVGQTMWKQSFGATPQCTTPSPTPTPPHAVEATHATRTSTPSQPLASTGVPTEALVGTGLVLLLGGGLLTLVATRRRNDGPSGS